MLQPNLTTLALTQGMIYTEAEVLSEQQEILVFTAGFNALGYSTKAELVALARSMRENHARKKENPLLNQLFRTVIVHLIPMLLDVK